MYLFDKICALNGIDVKKPFTARWVTVIDPANNICQHLEPYGDDIEVKNWEELADLLDDESALLGYRIEFQTYKVDENDEPIDETILYWMADWVDGNPRLSLIVS